MPSAIWDSFTGIADFENKGLPGAFKFGSGLMVRKKIDSLSCNYDTTDITGVITVLIKVTIPASDNNVYYFGKSGKIYKENQDGVISLVYTDAGGDIYGAAEGYDNAGKAYLYWATGTKLNRKEIPGVANWSDVNSGWAQKSLSAAMFHTMFWANGMLNICNGRYIAMVGYDGSFNASALTLSSEQETDTIIEQTNGIVIGTQKMGGASNGSLYGWGQVAQNYDGGRLVIPEAGVFAMVDAETLLIQAGNDGRIYYGDMISKMPITAFPCGGRCNPYGVGVSEGLALFGVWRGSNFDGNVAEGLYSYGRKVKNSNNVLNLDIPIDADEIGMVAAFNNRIIISYEKGATKKLLQVDREHYRQAIWQSLDVMPNKAKENEDLVWGDIELTHSELASGQSIQVWYRFNKTGSFVQAYMEGGVAETTAGKRSIFHTTGNGDIVEVKLVINPSTDKTTTPNVYKVQWFYD